MDLAGSTPSMRVCAVVGSLATLPSYRSTASARKPSLANSAAMVLISSLRPHHSWTSSTDGAGVLAGTASAASTLRPPGVVTLTVSSVSAAMAARRGSARMVASGRPAMLVTRVRRASAVMCLPPWHSLTPVSIAAREQANDSCVCAVTPQKPQTPTPTRRGRRGHARPADAARGGDRSRFDRRAAPAPTRRRRAPAAMDPRAGARSAGARVRRRCCRARSGRCGRSGCGRVRLIGEPGEQLRNPASSSWARSARRGAVSSARGRKAYSASRAANLFQGQTARQSSQP